MPATQPAQADAATPAQPPRGEDVIICCSGGGIRSAAFCLGALQTLQRSALFARVTTITAVSGGSYIAAAWSWQHRLLAAERGAPDPAEQDSADAAPASHRRRFAGRAVPARYARTGRHAGSTPITPPTEPRSTPAFDLGTPEERHVRENTRYLAPDAPTTLFGLSALVLGILVNLVLVGVPLLLVSTALGWALRGTGLLGGLSTASPYVHLPAAVWIGCFAPLVLGQLIAWSSYLFSQTRDRDVLVGRRFRATVDARHDPNAPPPSWLVQAWHKWRDQDHTARAAVLSWLLVRLSLLGIAAFILAPAAVGFLSRKGAGTGALAVVLHGLGFGSHGVAPAVTFPAYVAALAGLARTAIGKIRTYQKDLDGTLSSRKLASAGSLIRDRLAPYLGAALVVVSAAVGSWALVGLAVRTAPYGQTSTYWLRDLVLGVIAIGLWLVVRAFVDINHTSLHRYYRDRLAAAYAGWHHGTTPAAAKLSDLLVDGGNPLPNLVLCASAAETGAGDLPPGRNAVSFTFTPSDVGLSDGRTHAVRERAPTVRFEQAAVDFSLFDAVAVSGAAVAPLMGRMTTPSKRILFALTNVRLGMWLPSPAYVDRLIPAAGKEHSRLRRAWIRLRLQHNLRRLWAEMVGTLHLDGKWLYVTDGGHYENLGLVEALRRRPSMVIVLDASGDSQGHFTTLGQAVALARTECEVDVDIDPSKIAPMAGREVAQSVVTGSYTYRSDGRAGALVFSRLGVTPRHPWDVRSYLAANATFPTTSTLSQLYDDAEFEAYRAMGETTGRFILEKVPAAESDVGAQRSAVRTGPS